MVKELEVSKSTIYSIYFRIKLFEIVDKLLKSTLSGLRKMFVTRNFSKLIRNTFFFTLKTLFVHKKFKFSLDFFTM